MFRGFALAVKAKFPLASPGAGRADRRPTVRPILISPAGPSDEIEPAYQPLRLGRWTLIVMAVVTAAAFAVLMMWTPQNARHVRDVVGATLLLLAAGVVCRAGHSVARKFLRRPGQALADAAILLILFAVALNVAQTMFR